MKPKNVAITFVLVCTVLLSIIAIDFAESRMNKLDCEDQCQADTFAQIHACLVYTMDKENCNELGFDYYNNCLDTCD